MHFFLNAGCPIKVFYNKYIKKHNLFGFGKVFPNHQQIEGYNKIKNGRHETGQKWLKMLTVSETESATHCIVPSAFFVYVWKFPKQKVLHNGGKWFLKTQAAFMRH